MSANPKPRKSDPRMPLSGTGRPRKWHEGNAHEALPLLDAYFADCEEKNATPHLVGCAFALGMSYQEWMDYEGKHEHVPAMFLDALKMARSRCLRDLVSGTLDSKTTPIGKIFIGKALMGLRDGSEGGGGSGGGVQVIINTTREAIEANSGQVIDVRRVDTVQAIGGTE